MNHDDLRRYADDYVDGSLDDALCESFEKAMAESEALRAEVDALYDLKREVGRLPNAIVPERDLWPEIQERIGSPGRAIDFDRFLGLRLRYPLFQYVTAAAALALFAAGTAMLYGYQGEVKPATPGVMAVDPELGRIEEHYFLAKEELMSALNARRAALPEATLAVVEENLAIIESALVDINLALVSDPERPELERMLYATYRSEVDLLQQAIWLAGETEEPGL